MYLLLPSIFPSKHSQFAFILFLPNRSFCVLPIPSPLSPSLDHCLSLDLYHFFSGLLLNSLLWAHQKCNGDLQRNRKYVTPSISWKWLYQAEIQKCPLQWRDEYLLSSQRDLTPITGPRDV